MLHYSALRAPSLQSIHRFVLCRVLVLCVLGMTGCVPAARFEEANSALGREREARRALEARLAAVSQRLDALLARREALEAGLRRLERDLASRDESLQSAELSAVQAERERAGQALLVTQLQSELERVGLHLRVFASDKAALADELAACGEGAPQPSASDARSGEDAPLGPVESGASASATVPPGARSAGARGERLSRL